MRRCGGSTHARWHAPRESPDPYNGPGFRDERARSERRATTMRAAGILIGTALVAVALAADPPGKPRELGLMEQTSTRLAQIDVTVSGPKSAIEGLTTRDFEVKLNDKFVRNVIVDDLCLARPAAAAATPHEAAAATAVAASIETPKAATVTYLVYFDMPHLTQSGRRGSIDDAREMLPFVTARTLVLVGALDAETPPAYARAIAEIVPGAELVVVPGAGHLLPAEAPDAVNRAIRAHVGDGR